MSDFLADRLNKHSITVTGISPYGFGTPDMFWDIPAEHTDSWEDVTELTQGVPPQQSGVMLLRQNEPVEAFHQNIATYTWVLDGAVPFETIFAGLKEPIPEGAAVLSSTSKVGTLSEDHSTAELTTRFTDDDREMISTTHFTWYKLDGSGTQFTDPSVLIQRTLVTVAADQPAPLPTFAELPESVDELGK